MKLIRTLLFILLCTAATAGCEKFTLPDDVNGNSASNGKNDGPEDDVEIENPDDRCLTVAEALKAEDDKVIIVRGYIVGATERSMKNAIYKPPFTGKSALIIADRRLTDTDGFYEDELLPARINDYEPYKDALNLVDHPNFWNKEVILCGVTGTYFGQPGITEILEYHILGLEPTN